MSRAEVFPENSSKLKYFSCNSKKGDRAGGPLVHECGHWSANHEVSTKSTFPPQENKNFNNNLFILPYP